MKQFKGVCAAGILAAVCGVASAVELTADRTEVVIAPEASPAVRFAADEATNFLAQVFGASVPVVNAPTDGKVSLVLGSNDWSRAAGIDTARLAHDEFVIRADGNRVYVAGRDDPEKRPQVGKHERATLFGVYELLYRFAGVRAYFPGELGTIVPKAGGVKVPDGTLAVKPDYLVRRFGPKDGIVPEEILKTSGCPKEDAFKTLNRLRLRTETMTIPCCHGQLRSRFYRRFHETHPEYFVMGKDGKRHPTEAKEKPLFNKEHMCNSSAIWDEIYLDAKAYLTGQPPEVRKIPSDSGKGYVHGPGAYGKYYDIMPHDGFGSCHCEPCRRRLDKSRSNYATEVVWSNTVAIAKRLKAEGVPGYVVQMAYHPYADVPDFDIPDNVLVMVAQQGPWARTDLPDGKDPDARVKAWTKKLGHKVWLWTYPDKIFDRTCPGIPQMSPRAWGGYFGRLRDHIIGGFGESESDRWIFNYLNYYVFSRVCWDSKTDVEAVLDEHYRLMFGAGAAPMKRLYDALERKWVKEMMHNTRMGKVGPETVIPGYCDIWTKIYSPAVLAEFEKDLDEAAAAVAPGSLEARRVALMRRELLGPLVAQAERAHEKFSPEKALKRRNAGAGGAIAFEDSAEEPVKAWKSWPNDVALTRAAEPGPVSKAPLAMKSSDEGDISMVWHGFTLQPNRRYRLSCFVKLEDVTGGNRGGVCFSVKSSGKKLKLVDENGAKEGTVLTGTTGWIYCESFFESPAETKPNGGSLTCRFYNAHGKAYFDGLRIEEMGR